MIFHALVYRVLARTVAAGVAAVPATDLPTAALATGQRTAPVGDIDRLFGGQSAAVPLVADAGGKFVLGIGRRIGGL